MEHYPRLKELITKRDMDEMFQACWFSCNEPISDRDWKKALTAIPWLPNEYGDFLKVSNGCVLHVDVFYNYILRELGTVGKTYIDY